MNSKSEEVHFALTPGGADVDIHTIEKMKEALQSFISGPDFPARFQESREPMIQELKSSVAWIQGSQAGIGLWKLEARDEHLKLVRYPPPRKGTQYLYHATLTRSNADAEWKIISFEQEKESGPR